MEREFEFPKPGAQARAEQDRNACLGNRQGRWLRGAACKHQLQCARTQEQLDGEEEAGSWARPWGREAGPTAGTRYAEEPGEAG